MTFPAARSTDMHVCPMFTGVVPHVGGPVSIGEPTVLIGNLPAARVGDMAICVGPPDTHHRHGQLYRVDRQQTRRAHDLADLPWRHGGDGLANSAYRMSRTATTNAV